MTLASLYREALEADRCAGDQVWAIGPRYGTYIPEMKHDTYTAGAVLTPNDWGIGIDWSLDRPYRTWTVSLQVGPFHAIYSRGMRPRKDNP